MVLLIEDHPVVRKALAGLLTADGLDVETAPDGETGLDMILRLRPELIVCNYKLPGINGLEVLSRVRGDTEVSQTLFLMLSATIDGPLQKQAEALGVSAFLSKQGGAGEEVLGAVHRLLDSPR